MTRKRASVKPTAPTPKDAKIEIRISPELKREAQQLAASLDKDLSDWIRDLIRAELAKR